MKNLVIYHRVDYDGVFSALIVKWFNTSEQVDLFGYNYGGQLPNFNEITEKYDAIWIVDVSFDPKIMTFLKNWSNTGVKKLYWIDHHITAIQNSEEFEYSSLPGIRDKSRSATENVWRFLSEKKNFIGIPKVIRLIGAYDIWDHDSFDWNTETLALQSSLKAKFGVSTDNIWPVFNELLFEERFLDDLLKLGVEINEYNRKRWESAVKSHSFEITVDGRLKGVCILGSEFTSVVFQSVEDEYDIYCVANRKNDNLFSVSLYGYEDRLGDFSCGEYMLRNYSGGGHKGAAGGKLNLEQFIRLINDREI